MAEIKSTLEMVMERAAKMAAESTQDSTEEESEKIGMRLAADYLNNGEGDLKSQLQEQKADERLAILKGMAETLLRNIVLPRDEMLVATGERALKAILDLAPSQVVPICEELQQILNQYNQHKEQMQKQVEDAMRTQLEQKLAQEGHPVDDNANINPAMHPQYQEEMARMLSELNGQYIQALDQRKAVIIEQLLSTT